MQMIQAKLLLPATIMAPAASLILSVCDKLTGFPPINCAFSAITTSENGEACVTEGTPQWRESVRRHPPGRGDGLSAVIISSGDPEPRISGRISAQLNTVACNFWIRPAY